MWMAHWIGIQCIYYCISITISTYLEYSKTTILNFILLDEDFTINLYVQQLKPNATAAPTAPVHRVSPKQYIDLFAAACHNSNIACHILIFCFFVFFLIRTPRWNNKAGHDMAATQSLSQQLISRFQKQLSIAIVRLHCKCVLVWKVCPMWSSS